MGRNKYKLFASTIVDPSYTIISDDLALEEEEEEEEAYRHSNEDPEDIDMMDQDSYGHNKKEEHADHRDHQQDAYSGSIAKDEQQREKGTGPELHRNNKELELELELELEEKDPYREVIRELQERQAQERDKSSSHDSETRNKRPREESSKYRGDVDQVQDAYRNAKEGRHDEESYMYCNPGQQRTQYTTSLVHQPGLLPEECSRGVMHMEVHMACGIKGSYMLGQVKTSPYVVVKYGHDKKELRTSVDKGGGSCPSWNETFFYNIMNPAHRPPLLHIEIWDQLVARKDKLLGRVSIDNILEYVCKNTFMCTQHMWLPIFYHRKKDYDVRERGKLLVRFWFETKDPTYFGDARWRDDHTYSKLKSKEKKSVDMTAAGMEPKYMILTNILVLQYAGTVIRLDVNDVQ